MSNRRITRWNPLSRVALAAAGGVVALLLVSACGPKHVVPEGDEHPANANAPPAPETPASTALATGEVASDTGKSGGMEGMDHDMNGMDHDMNGMDHDTKGMDHDKKGTDHDMDKPADKGHAHGGEAGDKGSAKTPAGAELAAFKRAKPVFDKYCASCHTSKSTYRKKDKAIKHFVMDSYPFGGHHAAELGKTIRLALGASGKKAKMPLDDPGAVAGKELALVLEWADAFDKAHPAAAGGHQH